jgi:hypothetical protein
VDHAVIRYGGHDGYYHSNDRGGIALASASPTIQNTTFRQNAYCAITADMYSFPNLSGNTLEDNAANGLCLLNINGDLDIDATWDITDTSYYLRDSVIQAEGKTLTVASGVVVKFGNDKSLMVNGTLTAQGTESTPVYFTSYRDDSIGGDTNGDGVSSGARGDWRRIEFTSYSSPSSLVDHAVIRYGGDSSYGAITLLSASPTIQNSTICTSSKYGILANNSTPILGCNNIYDNGALSGGIRYYGLYNATASVIVNAENQWWGSTSGPYHSTNPDGTGNAVTDGVDFGPWRTSPCGTAPTYTIYIPLALRNSGQ